MGSLKKYLLEKGRELFSKSLDYVDDDNVQLSEIDIARINLRTQLSTIDFLKSDLESLDIEQKELESIFKAQKDDVSKICAGNDDLIKSNVSYIDDRSRRSEDDYLNKVKEISGSIRETEGYLQKASDTLVQKIKLVYPEFEYTGVDDLLFHEEIEKGLGKDKSKYYWDVKSKKWKLKPVEKNKREEAKRKKAKPNKKQNKAIADHLADPDRDKHQLSVIEFNHSDKSVTAHFMHEDTGAKLGSIVFDKDGNKVVNKDGK